jgi:hypothetical protein
VRATIVAASENLIMMAAPDDLRVPARHFLALRHEAADQ